MCNALASCFFSETGFFLSLTLYNEDDFFLQQFLQYSDVAIRSAHDM